MLREKGLAASAKRDDRENNQGVVSLVIDGNVGANVKLKSETDFVASSDGFKAEADTLAALVAAKGPEAVAERANELDELKILLKEKIELGEVVRIEAGAGNVLDSYVHIQGGRGVNAVLVEVAGGSQELAHDIAVHIAFAKPKYLRREDVPAEEIEKERATLETITRNEGKPSRRSPRSSRAVSVASSRTSCCSSSPTPRTTSSRSPRSWAGRPSCPSHRSRSAKTHHMTDASHDNSTDHPATAGSAPGGTG